MKKSSNHDDLGDFIAKNAPNASVESDDQPSMMSDLFKTEIQSIEDTTSDSESSMKTFIADSSSSEDDFSETVVPNEKLSQSSSAIFYPKGKSEPPGIIGDYQLIRELGHGGMGTVFLADKISFKMRVALKTLSYEYSHDESFVQRFLRESKAMSILKHENVVQVYETKSAKGIYFSAIEYIDGHSLQEWMDRLKKLKVGDALYIILVCADALRHAQQQNLIHRDIKPGNILITKKGKVKVADFGLAKILDDTTDYEMTQSGMGMGTPLYMPPEQARNAKHVDHRSDIYSLGCTLYFLLTGSLPFDGDNAMELFLSKEKGVFTPAKRLNPVIPEKLDFIIHKMIAKDVSQRYEDYDELIFQLQSLGLDHSNLSFIRGSVFKPAQEVKKKKKASNPNIDYKSIPFQELSSSKDAQSGIEKKSIADHWIVWHLNEAKKITTCKLSSSQIKTGIKKGIFNSKTKATKSTKSRPVPLCDINEFSDFIKLLKSRKAAKENSRHLAEQFDILDKADKRRKKWRWVENMLVATKGYLGIIAFLLFASLIGLLVYEFGMPYIQDLTPKPS